MKLLLTLTIGCLAVATYGAEKPALTANATNHFNITGMHCDGCAGGLTAELKETKGVVRAEVTFSNKLAVVAYDTNQINTTQLTKTIKEAGFAGKVIQP